MWCKKIRNFTNSGRIPNRNTYIDIVPETLNAKTLDELQQQEKS